MGDESDDYADMVLGSLTSARAWVPNLWPFEVSNALLMAERRGRLKAAESAQCLKLLGSLPIVVNELTHTRAMSDLVPLARQYSLTVYDAAYLDLAILLSAPLAALDKSLKAAARKAGVEFFQP